MKIGIPRALLYHQYGQMWETFFEDLDCQVILSPETTKDLLTRGELLSIDEACLSSKIFMGHVEWLIGRCDCIFVPRIANFGEDGIMCTKFEALYDLVANTFREQKPSLLDCEIDEKQGKKEKEAFLQLGKRMGKRRSESGRAYDRARKAYQDVCDRRADALEEQLKSRDLKILVVAHPYLANDQYIGKPVLDAIRQLGATPLLACHASRQKALKYYAALSPSVLWTMSRELIGAVAMYESQVDGIILMSAFPCGPDSLVNELLMRRIKGKPMLQLTMEVQSGNGGIETRLESFIDIIHMKQEKNFEIQG